MNGSQSRGEDEKFGGLSTALRSGRDDVLQALGLGGFYRCAYAEDGGLVEVLAHDLNADGQAFGGGAAGDTDAADAGQ